MAATTSKKKKKKKKKKTAIDPGISDAAVKAKTGKTWPQWYKLLDAAGAKEMNHKEIVAQLKDTHGEIGGWWMQMVTVAYEQTRGLRAKHEKPAGYEIGASKTIQTPLSRVFKAWQDGRTRRKWLADPGFEVRKATKDKSMRITWVDGRTSVNVNFYAKGAGKSQVALQHGKLKSAKAAEAKKKYWKTQLEELKDLLEG